MKFKLARTGVSIILALVIVIVVHMVVLPEFDSADASPRGLFIFERSILALAFMGYTLQEVKELFAKERRENLHRLGDLGVVLIALVASITVYACLVRIVDMV